MQVLITLSEGKFYVTTDEDKKDELPTQYDPDDYWNDWDEIEADNTDIGFTKLTEKLWDIFHLAEKSNSEY